MPPINANLWTAEQDTILRAAHSDGISFSKIAGMVGRTRNACIGRASRLHLQVRITPELRKEWAQKRAEKYKANRADKRATWYPTQKSAAPRPLRKRMSASEIAALESYTPDFSYKFPFLNIPLIDLQPHHCRFPRGEGPFLFCGQPKQFPEVSSYCAHHNSICFDRKRTAEGWMRAREKEIQFQLQRVRVAL